MISSHLRHKYLHIVAHMVPYPVNFGGVFDIFFKISALHKQGIKIYLHCFSRDNAPVPLLNQMCECVYFYARKTGVAGLSPMLPYIVSSRSSKELTNRLLQDDHPILLEGVHCTALLLDPRFKSRNTILRLHNVEYVYYKKLFASSRSVFKKIYYLAESRLLRKHEKKIAGIAHLVLPVSEQDKQVYHDEFKVRNIKHLPVFTGFTASNNAGKGEYCLYHGNLSVAENEYAVAWLLYSVFKKTNIPLIVAGKAPTNRLKKLLATFENIRLIADPCGEELHQLVMNAQCHVLPSFNSTGVKLKLIYALFYGRHCIVNTQGVQGSGLECLCTIAGNASEFARAVKVRFKQPFTDGHVLDRSAVLDKIYNDDRNCETLIRSIW